MLADELLGRVRRRNNSLLLVSVAVGNPLKLLQLHIIHLKNGVSLILAVKGFLRIRDNTWEGPSTQQALQRWWLLFLTNFLSFFFFCIFLKTWSKTWLTLVTKWNLERQVYLRHILSEDPKRIAKSQSINTGRSLFRPLHWSSLLVNGFSIVKGISPGLALYGCLLCILCKGNWPGR